MVQKYTEVTSFYKEIDAGLYSFLIFFQTIFRPSKMLYFVNCTCTSIQIATAVGSGLISLPGECCCNEAHEMINVCLKDLLGGS